jgi:hypothetical protein
MGDLTGTSHPLSRNLAPAVLRGRSGQRTCRRSSTGLEQKGLSPRTLREAARESTRSVYGRNDATRARRARRTESSRHRRTIERCAVRRAETSDEVRTVAALLMGPSVPSSARGPAVRRVTFTPQNHHAPHFSQAPRPGAAGERGRGRVFTRRRSLCRRRRLTGPILRFAVRPQGIPSHN